mgnify:CR=1 FL=1
MISYIIRTYNEERWVGHCIQSIINNSKEKFEVIVVDNESTDDSLQIVKMFKNEDFQMKVLKIPKDEYTPGKALNMGLTAASKNSKIGCLISAHCTVERVDEDKISSHFANDDCFGIIGKQIPIFKGKKLRSAYVWENFSHDEVVKNLKENNADESPFFHNAFSFVNLEIWRSFKFCEKVTGKEDRVWAKDLFEKGYHSLYDSGLVCLHHWTPRCATWSGMG